MANILANFNFGKKQEVDSSPVWNVGQPMILKDFYKKNTVITEPTHAKFIKHCFDKNLKQLNRCTYMIHSDLVVWMIRFDEVIDSFRNTWLDKFHEEVLEEYVGWTGVHDGKPVSVPQENYRIVVEVIQESPRKYKIRGLYRLDRKRSTEFRHFYNIVKNGIPE